MARQRGDQAPPLVAAAREETEVGELLFLPLIADRLEGRAAAAAGDMTAAAELLRRSAEGFAELEARREEAWFRLLLAEVLAARMGGPRSASSRRRNPSSSGWAPCARPSAPRALRDQFVAAE